MIALVEALSPASGTTDDASLTAELGWLADALTSQDSLGTLSDAAAVLANAGGVALVQLWLLDESGEMIELHASAGAHESTRESQTKLPVAGCLIGKVARGGMAQFGRMPDLDSTARHESSVAGLDAAVYPLRIGTRSLGALAVCWYPPISQRLLDLLPAAARILALAADRRRITISRQRLVELLDATPDLVTISPVHGSPSYINPAARRALGIGPQEAVESLLEFRPPGFGSFAKERLFPDAARDGSWRGETDYVTRDGDVIHASQVSVAHYDEHGELKCLSTISRDISEETARREELKRAGERTRFALEAARAGVWENDLRTGRVIWSDTMRSVQGFGAEEFGGTFESFRALIHPADRERVDQAMQPDAVGSDGVKLKFRTLWPDGTTHWVESHGRVIRDQHGRPVRALGMAQDVTEREHLEQQLRQVQKMEAIGQLAGGVAHDFNNLLTVILGYSNLLVEQLDETDPRRGDVAEIQHAGKSAAQLTQQLLAFSRRQVLQPAIVSVNELVTESARMLGRLIGEHIELVLQLQPSLAAINADRGQMEQILVNLAVNARDAMPRGGTLSIRTANEYLDQSAAEQLSLPGAGNYISIAVKDTGCGMDAQTKARIFEPFFTTKAHGKGTGLGLATVFGIVAQSGGAIAVQSEPGRGAEFKVWLSAVAASDVHADKTDAPRPTPRGTETVLLVEDEPSVRAFARTTLARAGYRVLPAENAGEALKIASATDERVHLLVSDVVMPGLSGPDLYAQLHAARPDLRVLFVSGFAHDTVADHGVLAPEVPFLPKPFAGPELAAKVRQVLDRG